MSPEDPPQEQAQEQGRKKKQKGEKLAFELGKVFSPGADLDDVGKEIEELSLDAARFKAAKGQAGTRSNPGSSNPYDYQFDDVRV